MRAQIPEGVVGTVRLGSQNQEGVRGIVADEVVRRVVARTVAQQLALPLRPPELLVNLPCPLVLGECAAPALQFLTQAGPEATNTSVDGVGDFDYVSAERCCKVWPG